LVDELIAAAEAGVSHFTDASMLSLRAWIRLARGDMDGAERDSKRAVEVARASDAQAQVAVFTIRPAVVLATGGRAEAQELASELAAFGGVILSAMCWPFPSFTDVAWVFRDLGREEELRTAILDPTPLESLWLDAARAIADGDLVRAADVAEEIGHAAAAAFSCLRAAEAFAAAGRGADAAEQSAKAQPFFAQVGAVEFLRRLEAVGGSVADARSASSQV